MGPCYSLECEIHAKCAFTLGGMCEGHFCERTLSVKFTLKGITWTLYQTLSAGKNQCYYHCNLPYKCVC